MNQNETICLDQAVNETEAAPKSRKSDGQKSIVLTVLFLNLMSKKLFWVRETELKTNIR